MAFLRDPRAKEAALELRQALRESESAYLERLLAATGDLRVCDTQRLPSGELRACVFNASQEPQAGVALRLRALDAPISHRDPLAPAPTVLREWKLDVGQPLQPGHGVRVRATPEGLAQVRAPAFELVADRSDRL